MSCARGCPILTRLAAAAAPPHARRSSGARRYHARHLGVTIPRAAAAHASGAAVTYMPTHLCPRGPDGWRRFRLRVHAGRRSHGLPTFGRPSDVHGTSVRRPWEIQWTSIGRPTSVGRPSDDRRTTDRHQLDVRRTFLRRQRISDVHQCLSDVHSLTKPR